MQLFIYIFFFFQIAWLTKVYLHAYFYCFSVLTFTLQKESLSHSLIGYAFGILFEIFNIYFFIQIKINKYIKIKDNILQFKEKFFSKQCSLRVIYIYTFLILKKLGEVSKRVNKLRKQKPSQDTEKKHLEWRLIGSPEIFKQ